jgi:hypothetical protein
MTEKKDCRGWYSRWCDHVGVDLVVVRGWGLEKDTVRILICRQRWGDGVGERGGGALFNLSEQIKN